MSGKGIAFDLEGTVINVEPAHHGGWLSAAKEIGVELTIPEAIEKIPHFIGGPDMAIFKEFLALAPEKSTDTDEAFKKFMARKRFYYDQLLQTLDLSPRPGFLEVLGKFRCLGIRTTIGTAVELEQGLLLFRRSGLDNLFSLKEIVLLTDFKNTKPAPDCFLETAARMKIDPADQIVFEDSPRGVESGVAAGSTVIGMPIYDNKTAINNLCNAGAVKIYMDWRQIDVQELL